MANFEINFKGNNADLKKALKENDVLLKRLQNTAKNISLNIGGKSAITNITNLNTKLQATKNLLSAISKMSVGINTNLGGTTTSVSTSQLQQEKLALAESRTQTQRYREEVARLQAALAALRLEQGKNRNQTQAAAGSYKEAQQRLTAMGKAIREAGGGFDLSNPKVRAAVDEYRKLNSQLKEFDKAMGNNQRNVGNYPFLTNMGKSITALIGSYVSLYAVIAGVGSVIKSNREVSDSLADIQRTTGLTSKETEKLAENLRAIPTRTGLSELLDTAVIAGQLGIANNEIAGFVKSLDFLSVALAKEIPGGAEVVAQSLGKINGVFRVAQDLGLSAGDAMAKTGSSILALGQAGLATGEFLVDFTQRVGGAAKTAGIALPTMLAYGAALEEAGVSAEVAGTAVSKLIGQLAVNRDKFFNIAALADSTLTLQQFTNLINTDTDAALRKFFAGLKAGGGTLTEFYDILGSAKINTERYRNAVLLLANNQERLTELTAIGTREFNNGTLAAEQFEKRNLSLAGVLDQVGRLIRESFIDIGASNGLAQLIARVIGLQTSLDQLAGSVRDSTSEFNKQDKEVDNLLARYTTLSNDTNRTTEENIELRDVFQRLVEIVPSAATEFDRYGNAIGLSTEKVRELSRAQRDLIRDQNISAVRDLNTGFTENRDLLRRLEESRNRQLSMFRPGNANDQRNIEKYREFIANANQEAIKLAQNIERLGGDLTAEQRNLLAYYGLDAAGEAMRKYDQSIKNAKNSVKALGDQLKTLGDEDGDGAFTSISEITKRIAELKKVSGSAIKGSPVFNEIKELQARLRDLNGSRTSIRVEAEPGSFKALQKQLSDLQARSDSSIIGSATFKQIQALEKRIKVLGDAMKNPVTLSSYLKKNFEAAVKALDKMNFDGLKLRGDIQTSLNIDAIVAGNTGGTQAGQSYQDIRARMLADQDRWAKESSKNAKKAGEDYYQAFTRGVDRFATDFYDVLSNLNQATDRSFTGIFSNLTNGLLSSFNQVFLGQLTNSLTKNISTGLDDIKLFGFENKMSKALLAGAGLAGGVLKGIFSQTSSAGQGLAGGVSGAAVGVGLGSSLIKGTIGGLSGGLFGAIAGGLVGIVGGIFGASKARKQQEEIQRQQLAELKKQTELARQSALTFTSAIIGQAANGGIVNAINRDEFGNLVATISGRDIKLSMERETAAQLRGL